MRPVDNAELPDSLSEIMDFSSYDLCTTVRLIVLSGETRTVQVTRGSKQGSIYIKGGEIYAAVTNSCQGDEAFFEMLSWDTANHSDYNEPNGSERNVRIPTKVLLEVMNSRNAGTLVWNELAGNRAGNNYRDRIAPAFPEQPVLYCLVITHNLRPVRTPFRQGHQLLIH